MNDDKTGESIQEPAAKKAPLVEQSLYDTLDESEPFLGPAWAFVMLLIYIVMQQFAVQRFSIIWWIEIYVIALAFCITMFTLFKRWNYNKARKEKREKTEEPKL